MVLFSSVDRITTGTIGFPRIGPKRELKFALEKYWNDKINETELKQIAKQVENENWKLQQQYHIQKIGVGFFTFYDHILDWTCRLGCIPQRFETLPTGSTSSSNSMTTTYFTMARGKDNIPALEMKKWFDTNYHYLVPELTNDIQPKGIFNEYLTHLKDAIEIIGKKSTIPIIIGPLTFLSLSRLDGITFTEMLDRLIPIYRNLFEEIQSLDLQEIQIHEPSLVTSKAQTLYPCLEKVYGEQTGCLRGLNLKVDLVTYFDDIDENVYQWFLRSNLHSISLDFTQGNNLLLLEKYGFANNKNLGIGLVNGRSVWKLNSKKTKNTLERIDAVMKSFSNVSVCIQPSCSLQYLPYSLSAETKIQEKNSTTGLYDVLAFTTEKLQEINTLYDSIDRAKNNNTSVLLETYWNDCDKVWNKYMQLNPRNQFIQEKIDSLTPNDFHRSLPFEERSKLQIFKQKIPLLPTSTLGSFPQTKELRSLHLKYRKGLISKEEHDLQIHKAVEEVINIQDQVGIDVLVHGEPERSDMVEYFAEKLKGYMFTEVGWVQSYGSRCTRPPIIYADLERPNAMTCSEYQLAQRHTLRPVKGMLTGPGTMLKWSFPREDIPLRTQAYQLSFCIREEIADLEAVSCQVIQVDEPGFREGMPLKESKKGEYLDWAVKVFQLATAGARPETTIHTHMCYAEFHDCLEAIDALDADGILIENARNPLENLQQFKKLRCKIGVGMYDIHSPVIPSKEDLKTRLRNITKIFPLEQIMINPDCGLKTRQWEEVLPALKNMIEAAQSIRQELHLQTQM